MNAPRDLQRFLDAQSDCFTDVLQELQAGQKRSHWMWYVFPQYRGLGESETAREYAIQSLDEAQAYLADPVLGARLIQCTRLVLELDGPSIQQIFGFPDYLKFRSCMTLFAAVSPGERVFDEALRKYFDGEPDARTLQLLGDDQPPAN